MRVAVGVLPVLFAAVAMSAGAAIPADAGASVVLPNNAPSNTASNAPNSTAMGAPDNAVSRAEADVASAAKPCVVLLHGLAGQPWNWLALRRTLQMAGYRVLTPAYASRKQTVQVSVQQIAPAVADCKNSSKQPVHLVGHSLGGLLIRHYLQQYGAADIGRVVMLGTPNQGTELSDSAQKSRLRQGLSAFFLGPVLPQLQRENNSFLAQLAPPRVPTGILAGYYTPSPWMNDRFNGEPNDGMVSVRSSQLPNMTDFALIATTHIGLLADINANRQVVWFLSRGHFYRPTP